MKILILVGSYRRHGNTDQVTGLIKAELEKIAQRQNQRLEIDTIYLGHQNLGFCRGCRICFDRGETNCPLKDDLLEIKARVKAADGVLVASPVYVDDISGITKNWIDRMAHVCHRPEFAGKSAYLVVTVGASPVSHALRTLSLALSTWGFHIIGQAGFMTGASMKAADLQARYREKAAKIAGRFYAGLSGKKVSRPTFLSLMMFKIQQRSWQNHIIKDSYDYCYWQTQGWLDPRRQYYIPHASSRIKVALARLSGAVIGRFVS